MVSKHTRNDSNRLVKRRHILRSGAFASTLALAGCLGDESDSDSEGSGDAGEDENYPEETIRWIVPYGTGGGFDAYARGIAEFFPDHLPTDVDIRIDNVEGAGGRTGANELYRADPDGYTIGIMNIPGFIAGQLQQETAYDMREMSWIARPTAESYVLCVGADSEYNSYEDLQDAGELTIGAYGVGNTGSLVTLIAFEEMGIEASYVTGYDSTAEMVGATLREDLDAPQMVNWTTSQQFIEDNELKPVLTLASEPPADFLADVPTVEGTEYEDLAELKLQRPVAGPPGLADNHRDVLEEALLETVRSDEAQEWADEAGRPFMEIAGAQETQESIETSFDLFENYAHLFENLQ